MVSIRSALRGLAWILWALKLLWYYVAYAFATYVLAWLSWNALTLVELLLTHPNPLNYLKVLWWSKAHWALYGVLALSILRVFSLLDPSFVYSTVMTAWLALRRGAGWLGEKAAAARHPGAAGDHPDLIAVVPILLSHLPPDARRSLWQASKNLALEVWRSSPAVKLHLSDSPVRRWTQLLASPSLGCHPSPLTQLIKSKRPSFLPEAAVLQRIQSLSLSSMQLDGSSLESLKTLLPNLRHLSLVACHVKPAPKARQAAAADSNSNASTRQEELLRLSSFSSWESGAAAFVDRRHLRCLGTDDPGIFSMLESRQFPALCVLRLTHCSMSDAYLDALLGSKPQMREVCLTHLDLRRDHSAQACSWGLLRLQRPPLSVYSMLHALELAALPLKGIRRLVVGTELYATSNKNAIDLLTHGCVWSTAWPRLSEAAERMEFEPCITGWGHLWAWSSLCTSQVDLGLQDDEPGFTLHVSRSCGTLLAATGPYEARRLAAVVARRLQGGTLVYSGCDLVDPAAALLPLQSLSSTVHSLVLRNCRYMPEDPRLLFAWLPLHVERLVIKEERGVCVHPKFLRKEYRRSS